MGWKHVKFESCVSNFLLAAGVEETGKFRCVTTVRLWGKVNCGNFFLFSVNIGYPGLSRPVSAPSFTVTSQR